MPLYKGNKVSRLVFAAGTFTTRVPNNISYVRLICIGGGEGGTAGGSNNAGGGSNAGGRGGTGGSYSEVTLDRLFCGEELEITVGIAGIGGQIISGSTVGNPGTPGGHTYIRSTTSGWYLCWACGGGQTSSFPSNWWSLPQATAYTHVPGGSGGAGSGIGGFGGQPGGHSGLAGCGGGGGGSHSSGTSWLGGAGGFNTMFGVGSAGQAPAGGFPQEYTFDGVYAPWGGNGGGGGGTVNFVGTTMAWGGAIPGGGGGGGAGARSGFRNGASGARGMAIVQFIK
jgi:hypothetical protein